MNASTAFSVSITAPSWAKGRSLYVQAVVDPGNAVGESSEANNAGASAGILVVK